MLDQEWTNPQDPFAYSKVLTVAEKNASYCKHFQDTNFSYEIAASSRMPYSKANHLSNTILKSPLSQRVQGYASLSDADKAKIATQTRAFQDKLEAYGMTIQDQQSKEQWNHFIAAMAKEPEPSQKEQHKESQEKKEQRDQWNGAVATGSLAFSLYNSYNTNNALNTLFDELKTLHAQAYAALTAQ
ncbi:MAG: hypothetical protein KDK71_01335 [Chlamydiia bacterium]|nr:hypothetical protein [Chlamydiia bacterium]